MKRVKAWCATRRVGDVHSFPAALGGAEALVGSVAEIGEVPDRRASYALLDAILVDTSSRFGTAPVIRSIPKNHFFPNPEWLIAKFGG